MTCSVTRRIRSAGVVRPVVDGDAKCASVAAASVLAKVVRDRLMRAEVEHFPPYEFDRNKGYPSPAHQPALRGYGPSAIHRRSWAYVRDLPWCGDPGATCGPQGTAGRGSEDGADLGEVAGDRVAAAPVDQGRLSLAQMSWAFQQRVRNRQPDGGARGSARRPRGRCARATAPAGGRGRNGRKEGLGVGVARAARRHRTVPISTILPEVHDRHPVRDVADHREVVGDEQIGHPELSWRSSSRLTTPAWMETSSAETGSSSTSSLGCRISARAMPIRWRCPPENSLG